MVHFIIAISPLPLASARPLWQWFWALIIALATIVVLLRHRTTFVSILRKKHIYLFIILSFLFFIFVYVQSLSLSQISHSGSLTGSNLISQPEGVSSLNPARSLEFGFLFLSNILFFLLVCCVTKSAEEAKKLLKYISFIVFLYALYGFIVQWFGADTILWYEKWVNKGVLTSTFVNRNNFAAYAGIGIQATIACLMYQQSIGETVVHPEHRRKGVLVTFLLITSTAILMTQSRAGTLSTILGIASFLSFVMIYARQPRGARVWVSIGSGLIFLIFLAAFVLQNRLLIDANITQRIELYKILIDAISTSPVFGFGGGTFVEIFTVFKSDEIWLNFRRAHNDYLEIWVTTGGVGLFLLLGAIGVPLCRIWSRAGHNMNSMIAAALTTGCTIQIGLHSLVDFPIQIPAISYLLCAIVAACTVIVDSSAQDQG